jgi:hypothetical protein
MVNITSSAWFVTYLITWKPFSEKAMNNLQICNELAFVLMCYHQLVFTDFSKSANQKSLAGWSMVIIGCLNLIWPNGYLVVNE